VLLVREFSESIPEKKRSQTCRIAVKPAGCGNRYAGRGLRLISNMMPAPCLVLLDTVLIRVFVVSTVLMVAVGQALAIFTWVAVSEATAQERSTPVFALVLLLAILTSAFILFIPIARRCLHHCPVVLQTFQHQGLTSVFRTSSYTHIDRSGLRLLWRNSRDSLWGHRAVRNGLSFQGAAHLLRARKIAQARENGFNSLHFLSAEKTGLYSAGHSSRRQSLHRSPLVFFVFSRKCIHPTAPCHPSQTAKGNNNGA
jgi:hypothetical protein